MEKGASKVTQQKELIGSVLVPPNAPLIESCPKCGAEVTVEFITMQHTLSLVRKATCVRADCATRTYVRAKMAKDERPQSHGMRLICVACGEVTDKLHMHALGLVCAKCLALGRQISVR